MDTESSSDNKQANESEITSKDEEVASPTKPAAAAVDTKNLNSSPQSQANKLQDLESRASELLSKESKEEREARHARKRMRKQRDKAFGIAGDCTICCADCCNDCVCTVM